MSEGVILCLLRSPFFLFEMYWAHAPLLITVGQKETIPAKRSAREMVRTIRGAKGVMVPGVGHVWSLQAPDLFTETVRAWVTDALLPSSLIML